MHSKDACESLNITTLTKLVIICTETSLIALIFISLLRYVYLVCDWMTKYHAYNTIDSSFHINLINYTYYIATYIDSKMPSDSISGHLAIF